MVYYRRRVKFPNHSFRKRSSELKREKPSVGAKINQEAIIVWKTKKYRPQVKKVFFLSRVFTAAAVVKIKPKKIHSLSEIAVLVSVPFKSAGANHLVDQSLPSLVK